MQFIFNIVYTLLKFVSVTTGLTYNEINIVVYYILIPFVYVALLDRILRRHILKMTYFAGWLITLVVMPSFSHFADWLFDLSVRFLVSFNAVGVNYVSASVLICVVLPGLVFFGLAYWAYKDFWDREFARFSRKSRSS